MVRSYKRKKLFWEAWDKLFAFVAAIHCLITAHSNCLLTVWISARTFMRFWAHCDALSSISVVCRAIHCYPPQVLSARRHFPQKMPSLSAKAADNAGVDLKRNTFVCVLWRKTSRPQFRLMSAIDCDVICLTLLRHGNAWTCAQVVCR